MKKLNKPLLCSAITISALSLAACSSVDPATTFDPAANITPTVYGPPITAETIITETDDSEQTIPDDMASMLKEDAVINKNGSPWLRVDSVEWNRPLMTVKLVPENSTNERPHYVDLVIEGRVFTADSIEIGGNQEGFTDAVYVYIIPLESWDEEQAYIIVREEFGDRGTVLLSPNSAI